ncbi:MULTISPECIES: hybrid sensor histidine kinase/response regulator [Oxalobacteraceae]|uniref:hybrid sensor histidine kinase/response regulator n=1 Tax=Herminiimonas sp. Marseille-P9896 TaxID=2742211 RepID=UPI00158ECC47|nr:MULTISPECIES: hybrid sensor histidine kinase/response regulator [Oxalobacteraceae]
MNNHPAASAVETRIFDELVNVLYRQATPIFFGNFSVVILSVYLLWNELQHSVLLSWASAIFVLTLIRIVIVRRDLRAVHTPDQAERRAWVYTAFAGLSGCLWGSIGIFFFAPDSTIVTVFICILLAGMTGGSVASQSSFPPAYYAFALPTVLPFAIRCFMYGGPLFSVLALLSLFLLGVNLAYSRNVHRTVREAVSLRFENTQLIAQLRQEKERAESASRSKSQFLAAASHDLRQPTHALGLYIATLRALCSTPAMSGAEVGNIAGKLQTALKGLVQLLDVLLDISKLDAGAVKVKREVFDLQDLLETIDQQFSAVAVEQKLRFIVRPTAVLVQTDRALVHSILANFVSNALRYTESGKVLVGARRRGEFIEVQVLDTGIGIAAEQSQLIFSEFYQIGNAARRREHGLGLGLAIVKRTADLLKIRIGLRSIPGRGSVFSVWLPLAPQVSAAAGAAMSVQTPSSGAAKNILVIDDDAAVLDSMRLLLLSWGHQVTAVASLGDALQAAKTQQGASGPAFDLILSDFRLAENVSGVDVVQAVRQASGYAIPAVVITGDTSVESIQSIAGAQLGILHKPLAPEMLQEVLRDLH